MFSISAKGIYGLHALVDLAGAWGTGPRQIKEIAEAHDIPQHYLEQILVNLKKAGIVESFRGANGGYSLARNPEQLGILDILVALEGPLEITGNARRRDSLGFFWEKMEEGIRNMLAMNLEELRQQETERSANLVWDI